MSTKSDKVPYTGAKSPKESLSEQDRTLSLEVSPIKKEKLLKQKKEALRKKLRENLPTLTKQEIRRYRLPYHEAILQDLEENGFGNTAEFVKQLFDLQEKTRIKLGPGTANWQRPQLKHSKLNIDVLTKSLISAESAHKASNLKAEWDEMLNIAAHYAFGSDDWWWLGEQLLYQCVSMENPGPLKKQEAISYYIIGKYLIVNGKKMDSGKYYLDLARVLSQGKSWNGSTILGVKEDIIFIEASKLLFDTLMEEALDLIKTDPQAAADLSNIARKRASEACDHQGEYEALLLRSRCELFMGKTAEAIGTVTKALNLTNRKKNLKGVCEAKISLALAYLQHGKIQECFDCLGDLKELAKEYNLNVYVAQAYRFMGDYYLNQNMAYEATPLLMLAFYMFDEHKDTKRREKARTWAAISAGEELFPAFIELIKKCEDPEERGENLLKLIRWIDSKEFFWTQQSKFSFSYTDLLQSQINIEI